METRGYGGGRDGMKKYFARFLVSEIDADTGAPEWILLFKAGWNELEGAGKYFVDEEAFVSVCTQIARRGNDIVIDYERYPVLPAQAA